jgi:hypothetical protein
MAEEPVVGVSFVEEVYDMVEVHADDLASSGSHDRSFYLGETHQVV